MDEKTLYLECYSGISGDMTVAALIDLGADEKVLLDSLRSLKVDGYKVVIGRKMKSSIDACDFDVILEHDYDHTTNHHVNNQYTDYQHADHQHVNQHSTDYQYANQQNTDHQHTDHQNTDYQNTVLQNSDHQHMQLGHHEHRNLFEINSIIDQSEITAKAKELAKRIFYIIACAEAKVHAKSLEQVHFHEVGAIDSIVDIVAAAVCLDNLNIKNVIVSELYEGTGQIECQHGLLPIPVPAVTNIVSDYKLPLHITNVKGELVTPTGAALVAAIKTGDTLPKDMKILKTGLGAGKRNYSGATGLLRAMLIEDISTVTKHTDKVWVLEANLDDCSGEALAFAMELLFENGAKDVYYTPIFMKKNRPAYLLGVICNEEDIPELESIIFTHTTTIGIRKQETFRTVLPRIQKTVSTPYGEAIVKVCTHQNTVFIYPEYESVKVLCQKSGMDYMTMYHYIQDISQA